MAVTERWNVLRCLITGVRVGNPARGLGLVCGLGLVLVLGLGLALGLGVGLGLGLGCGLQFENVAHVYLIFVIKIPLVVKAIVYESQVG